MKSPIKPKRLVEGAIIGLFAPGSAANPESFAAGCAELERRGFSLRCPLDPTLRYQQQEATFGSASPEERAQTFKSLVQDPEIAAIFAVRGGYGSAHLLPFLDFAEIRRAGKIIVGYSDVTALLAAFLSTSGLSSFHGPTVAGEFAQASSDCQARESVEFLLKLLSDPDFHPSISACEIRSGFGRGRLLGGNLTLLQTLLGTPWDPDYTGSILFLEDIAEAPYRVHRALVQLRQAAKLKHLAGVVFGRFSFQGELHAKAIDDLLRESTKDIFAGTSYPILSSSEFGHEGRNLALPLGCMAEIKDGRLTLCESAVS